MSTSEPRWLEDDRAELLALAVYRESLCPLCGRPREICGAPEVKGKFEPVWEICQAQRAIAERQNATYTADNFPYRSSHLWGSTIKG